ncbi:MAG TPA: RsmB/NOP family class I SAM-dependent RNA methyltransferase [Opitutaceae bacterium]
MSDREPITVRGPGDSWSTAVRLVAQWLDTGVRLDSLMESLPPGTDGATRSRAQHLVYGVVRHYGRVGSALGRLIAHPPRFTTRAILFIAGYELIEAGSGAGDPGRRAKIVHHAVEKTKTLASADEARLVNAVVRKLGTILSSQEPPGAITGADILAEYFSHPAWLVRRWLATFGALPTRSLLEWNQAPAPVYARWRDRGQEPPPWLQPTPWAKYFVVSSGHWGETEALLRAGTVYIQDPGTRLAVDLLAPQAGESVLDLCAAPGGKSLLIADALGRGRVVAVDLPTARVDRLKENLARATGVETAFAEADLRSGLSEALLKHGLPGDYPGVLLDVPCSNTGVMRHRIDVRWRLQEGDFSQHARQQAALLKAASRLVSANGRLVYSTCSIDPAENGAVVDSFLDRHREFKLEKSVIAVPWIEGHDGAGAFLLRRDSSPRP